jgi:hypothetical protein
MLLAVLLPRLAVLSLLLPLLLPLLERALRALGYLGWSLQNTAAGTNEYARPQECHLPLLAVFQQTVVALFPTLLGIGLHFP